MKKKVSYWQRETTLTNERVMILLGYMFTIALISIFIYHSAVVQPQIDQLDNDIRLVYNEQLLKFDKLELEEQQPSQDSYLQKYLDIKTCEQLQIADVSIQMDYNNWNNNFYDLLEACCEIRDSNVRLQINDSYRLFYTENDDWICYKEEPQEQDLCELYSNSFLNTICKKVAHDVCRCEQNGKIFWLTQVQEEGEYKAETFNIIADSNWLLHIQIYNLDDNVLEKLIELRAEEWKKNNSNKTIIRITGCSHQKRCLTYEVSQNDLKAGRWILDG